MGAQKVLKLKSLTSSVSQRFPTEDNGRETWMTALGESWVRSFYVQPSLLLFLCRTRLEADSASETQPVVVGTEDFAYM